MPVTFRYAPTGRTFLPIAKDDVAYAGWMMRLGGVVDEFSIWRADTAIPSVASALVKVNTAGKLTAKGKSKPVARQRPLPRVGRR